MTGVAKKEISLLALIVLLWQKFRIKDQSFPKEFSFATDN